MTETDWLACSDPGPMLHFLSSKASDRKLRLFACAACRRIWPVLTHSQKAVELAERYVEGQASVAEFEEGREEAELLWSDPEFGETIALQHPYRGFSTLWSPDDDAVAASAYCAEMAAAAVESFETGSQNERAAQSGLLRCIFGPLAFHPLAIQRAWLTETVNQLSHAIYTDRTFNQMPILGDALEDAGCDNADILNHCRQPGAHARGCWVVDLILGKS